MRTRERFRRIGTRLLIATLVVAWVRGEAGPIPGVESTSGVPVSFPTPPSTKVLKIGEDQYSVTFHWLPGRKVTNPGVAGSFNGWDRHATPMKGPDAKGVYTAELHLSAGEYLYKFVAGENGWFTDPRNPDRVKEDYGGYNSVLRLGIGAKFRSDVGHQGDGQILQAALLHDPSSYLYFDASSLSDVVLRYRTLHNDVESVSLHLLGSRGKAADLEPMNYAGSEGPFDFYQYHLVLPSPGTEKPPAAYAFSVRDGSTTYDDPNTYTLDLSSARIIHTPDWARNAVWYQIMIDRFRDDDKSNDPEHTLGTGRVEHTSKWTGNFYTVQPWEKDDDKGLFKADGNHDGTADVYQRLYGGDFQGVEDKLDYLKNLGVTAIYFNPIFDATSAHKYNAKSYLHADDGYGVPGQFEPTIAKEDLLNPKTWVFDKSDKKFLELLREAKKRGFHVIIDGVFNHLGADAVPFLDVKRNGKGSRFAGWYDVLSWNPFKVSGWGGYGGLPQFRKNATGYADHTLRDHIFNITRRWMDPNGDGDPSDGVDGWRLDVPAEIPKPFWVKWCRLVRSINPNAYITGEIWDPAEKWLDGTTFDAVMNYQFRVICLKYFGNVKLKILPSEFNRELARLRLRYPRACTYALQNLLDSHDTDRVASRMMNPDLGNDAHYDGRNRKQDNGPDYNDSQPDETAYTKVKLMAIFQATYVGAPMIFYGTEVGIYGADDPVCRKPMWWEDLMPYDNPHYVIRKDVRTAYRDLFHLRDAHPVLRTGDYWTVLADDEKDVFAFGRYARGADEVIVVVLNDSGSEQTVTLPAPSRTILAGGYVAPRILYGKGALKAGGGKGTLNVTLPSLSGVVLSVRKSNEPVNTKESE